MYTQLLHLLAAVPLAFAFAFAQASAPAADAPPSTAPLAPSAPAATVLAFNPVVSLIQSALKDPTVNDPTPVAPLLSLVHSGIKTPASSPAPANPVVSLIQSGMRDPAMTPNPIVSLIRSALRPTTTYTQEPSFALSDIEFGSTLVPAPKPTINPVDPESTPGEVRFCTSAAYTSWNGDAADAICDAIQTDLGSCRNLSAALRGKVQSVRPDKGQLCQLFDDADCRGKTEGVKWPGVQNLRGRIGEGGGWANRVVSFRCEGE